MAISVVPNLPGDRLSARIAIVQQHIRLENQHDLEGVLNTFGSNARYDDEPWMNTSRDATAFGSFTSN